MSEGLSELFSGLGDIIIDLFNNIKETSTKFFVIFLWILTGIFVLPCVYIASVYYPMWEKWGEEL